MVKNVSWHWGNEQDVAFRKIKEVLVSKRCFAYYDVNKSMRMQVDALKLSFTNIHGLQSNFVECGSFLVNLTLLTFLLCVRQTWMTPLILVISL